VKTSSKSSVKGAAVKAASKVAVKVAAKAKPAPKGVMPSKGKPVAVKAKPVAKVTKAQAQPVKTAKPVAKTSAKKVVSKPVKAVVAKAKPKSKASVTSAAKSPTKVIAKAAPKVASKASVKAPVKTVAPAKTAAKVAVKVTAKTVLPAGGKSAPVKSVPKEVLKPVKASAKAPIAAPPEKVKSPAKTVADKVAPAVALVLPVAVASGDVPARATRPSARLAQITVPSMAQSVASTAAKASYLPNMPTQVMTPVFTASIKKDAKLANNWKTKKVEDLTDAEILAMSDDDYMNDAQMAFFRRKLVLLKNDILASAGQTTENLREDTVVVPDPADRATIEEEHALELRTRDRERKLLKKIEQSITRIDAGDYGYCDETGEPIGVGRLLARPTATLSLEAQQRRELKQKMFGD
jgi:DnaK suppressor protein